MIDLLLAGHVTLRTYSSRKLKCSSTSFIKTLDGLEVIVKTIRI